MTPTNAMVLAVYIGVVAAGVFSSRPGEVVFPGFAFFAGFAALPCLVSFLLVHHFGRPSLRKAGVSLASGLAAFLITWLIELYAIAQWAVTQPSSQVEGLISNFHVFAHVFLSRGLGMAALFLLVMVVLNRYGAQHARA
jgi:hypothetical protein